MQLDLPTRFKEFILNDLIIRFKEHENNQIYTIPTLLDPRFLGYYFSTDAAKESARQHLLEELFVSMPQLNQNDVIAKPAPTVTKTSSLWQKHQAFGEIETSDPKTVLVKELDRFLSRKAAAINSNPIILWENLKSEYTNLYPLARKHFTKMATSVSSERLFSDTGNTITAIRNRLTPQHLEAIILLKSMPQNMWELGHAQ